MNIEPLLSREELAGMLEAARDEYRRLSTTMTTAAQALKVANEAFFDAGHARAQLAKRVRRLEERLARFGGPEVP